MLNVECFPSIPSPRSCVARRGSRKLRTVLSCARHELSSAICLALERWRITLAVTDALRGQRTYASSIAHHAVPRQPYPGVMRWRKFYPTQEIRSDLNKQRTKLWKQTTKPLEKHRAPSRENAL